MAGTAAVARIPTSAIRTAAIAVDMASARCARGYTIHKSDTPIQELAPGMRESRGYWICDTIRGDTVDHVQGVSFVIVIFGNVKLFHDYHTYYRCLYLPNDQQG